LRFSEFAFATLDFVPRSSRAATRLCFPELDDASLDFVPR
jgi:hypothetical protein